LKQRKKITTIPQNIREKFCPAVGNTGAISVSQQTTPCFGFIFVGGVSRYLRNYFRVSSTQKKRKAVLYEHFKGESSFLSNAPRFPTKNCF